MRQEISPNYIFFLYLTPTGVWRCSLENCTLYESNELEKIQHEAARIVTGATKLISISSLLSETGWETRALRKRKHKLTLFYEMINGFARVICARLSLQQLEVHRHIVFVMLLIYKQFILTHNSILTLFCHRQYVSGMTFL